MNSLINKKTFYEMFRYVIVGGISAVVDILGLTFFVEVIFNSDKKPVNMAIATAAGFILGLICNYILSMMFVFTNDSQKEQNKKKTQTFTIFALVGVVGLVLTEVLMYVGMLICSKEGFWYVILSCFIKGIVLIWNYVGRKIFVYKGK
ncbi:MAG: GtrA family protein [Lachnospiraceae bacterium]|nr:GtrA family protein [Lachnospiraceae bacterium]